jgi:hypothetical protein
MSLKDKRIPHSTDFILKMIGFGLTFFGLFYITLVAPCWLSALAVQECIENQLTNCQRSSSSTEPIVTYLLLPYLPQKFEKSPTFLILQVNKRNIK